MGATDSIIRQLRIHINNSYKVASCSHLVYPPASLSGADSSILLDILVLDFSMWLVSSEWAVTSLNDSLCHNICFAYSTPYSRYCCPELCTLTPSRGTDQPTKIVVTTSPLSYYFTACTCQHCLYSLDSDWLIITYVLPYLAINAPSKPF